MVIFGGLGFNDVWTLSLAGPTAWAELPPPVPGTIAPIDRMNATAIWQPGPSVPRMLLFGGSHSGIIHEGGDLALWSLFLGGGGGLEGAWNNLGSSGPKPTYRSGHTAVFDSVGNRMVVFGGYDDDSLRNDVTFLALDGSYTWAAVTPAGTAPSPRYFHTAIYDPVGQRMLVYGGVDATGERDDVWSLSLTGTPTWTELSPSGAVPPARSKHSAVYEPSTRCMLIYGGSNAGGTLGDAWALSLAGAPAWSDVTPPGTAPIARFGHTAVYDPALKRMLVFGGLNAYGVQSSELWAFDWPCVQPAVTQQPGSARALDYFAQITLTAGATGVGPLSYQWFKNLTPVADGGHISGAQTAALHISPVACGDLGSYRLRVTSACQQVSQSDRALVTFSNLQQPPVYVSSWATPGTPRDDMVLAVDDNGNVYVNTNAPAGLVSKYDKTGNLLATWTGLDLPTGITVDRPRNFVYVLEGWFNRVRKFTTAGVLVQTIGVGTSSDGVHHLRSIAADPEGNLYVADPTSHAIETYGPDGTLLGQWGAEGTGDGEFASFGDVATDDRGHVYVSDITADRVQKFSTSGTYLGQWPLNSPPIVGFSTGMRLAVDDNGDVYVANENALTLQKFAPDGTLLAVWNSPGAGLGEYNVSGGIGLDHEGNLYVTSGSSLVKSTYGAVPHTPLSILQNPVPIATLVGNNASFSVAVAGTAPFAYQWRRDGSPLSDGGHVSGTHAASLVLTPAQGADAGLYDCVVTDACGTQATSAGAALGFCAIAQQPSRSLVAAGQTASFSVTATTSGPALAFQWRRSAVPLVDGGNISGATTPTLAIATASAQDVGTYDVVVSATCGQMTSVPAALLLEPCAAAASLANPGPPLGYLAGGNLVYDSLRACSIVFGGLNVNTGALNGDTWKWDGVTWTRVATAGPSPRYLASACYDGGRGRIVLFGGQSSPSSFFADTWEWNGTTWAQAATTGPGPQGNLNRAPMAYEAASARTILYTGGTGSDTWSWDGAQWTKLAHGASGPGNTHLAAMAYDPVRERIVYFDGGTWEWNGSDWAQVATTGPDSRYGHVMAYDHARGTVAVFGGIIPSCCYGNDLWEWNGVAWTQLVATDGDAAIYNAMDYDIASGELCVYPYRVGGSFQNEWTWGYGLASIRQQPAPQTVAINLAAHVSVDARGTVLTYRWRRGGVPLDDGGVFSGTGTSTLTISPIQMPNAGYYDVLVSNGCSQLVSQPVLVKAVCPAPPSITQQPADLNVPPGTPAAFTVAAMGCTAMQYQWRRNNVMIPGAMQPGLSLASVTAADSGLYSVEVSAGGLSTISRSAALNLGSGPRFVSTTFQLPSASQVDVTWRTQDSAQVRAGYGPNPGLGLVTSYSPFSTGAALSLPHGLATDLYARLEAVDAQSIHTLSPVRQIVFPPSTPAVTGIALPSPFWTNAGGPEQGLAIGMRVDNTGNAAAGAVRLLQVTLGGAQPRELSGVAATQPRWVANAVPLAQSVRMPADLWFKRAEIGAGPGGNATLKATFQWWESPAANAASHTFVITQRVRLPQ